MSERVREPRPGRPSTTGGGHPANEPRGSAPRRRRSSRTPAILAVAGVALLAAIIVTVALTRSPATPSAPSTTGGAGRAATLAQQVPASALDAVGTGRGVAPPHALPTDAPPLLQDGKPEVLYIGAEYCPFCAAQRWPLVVALGRFGGFSGLGGTESAADDVLPNTQTFTFHGATYASDILSFAGVETSTNQPDPAGGYTPLEQPTAAQVALVRRYDRPPYTPQAGAIPFLLIGNKYVVVGASYDASILQGMTREQIAAALSDPASPVAQGVDGAANVLTAAICRTTGGQPASVCSDPTITAIADALPTTP